MSKWSLCVKLEFLAYCLCLLGGNYFETSLISRCRNSSNPFSHAFVLITLARDSWWIPVFRMKTSFCGWKSALISAIPWIFTPNYRRFSVISRLVVSSHFNVCWVCCRYFTFLVDCKDPKACTILLRGASKDILAEVERNLQDAMNVARNVMIDPYLCPGGGASEMALSQVRSLLCSVHCPYCFLSTTARLDLTILTKGLQSHKCSYVFH